MLRMQIQLEPDIAERLRGAARDRGISIAALVREAVDRYFDSTPARSLADVARDALGAVSVPDGQHLARDHDRYAFEA